VANDFSGDSDVVALYRFESGALTTDSKNSNDLTAVNTPTADTTNYKEGSASALCDNANERYFQIADAALQSGFPLKYGESNTTFTVCSWFRSIDGTANHAIVGKYENTGVNARSIAIWVSASTDDLRVTLGYNSGQSAESVYDGPASQIDQNKWYHLKFTLNGQDWTLRVWDDNASAVLVSTSGTASNAVSIVEEPWAIGAAQPDNATPLILDGQTDEVIFFTRVVSDADQDDIIAGTYVAAGGAGKPAIYYQQMAHAAGM
jgi:hypothetical protein